MNRIKFTRYWDKLNDPKFTTIRSWNPGKEIYYRSCMGSEFQVWKASDMYPFRPEHVICHAWLHEVTVVIPAELSENMILKDVRLDGVVQDRWLAKLLKMDKALLLEFAKYPKPVQLNLEEVHL